MNLLSNHRGRTVDVSLTPKRRRASLAAALHIFRNIFIAVGLLLAPTGQAEDEVPLSYKVISIAGGARYSTTNVWTALRVGDELRAVSVFQTESKGSSFADVELVGPDGHGWGKVRMFSNCVLKPLRLDLKKSGSDQATDVRFDVAMGQIRVSLDGGSDYVFALNAARITPARSVTGSKETVFLFASPDSLTVLKGAVTASFGTGPEKMVRAGEQLRRDGSEATKLPSDAPELKLGE
jgi:hypothetical protein